MLILKPGVVLIVTVAGPRHRGSIGRPGRAPRADRPPRPSRRSIPKHAVDETAKRRKAPAVSDRNMPCPDSSLAVDPAQHRPHARRPRTASRQPRPAALSIITRQPANAKKNTSLHQQSKPKYMLEMKPICSRQPTSSRIQYELFNIAVGSSNRRHSLSR